MGVALMVVPGMAAGLALGRAPRPGGRRCGSCWRRGAALVVVALAWPLMVELTPASSRPWISGTNDNSVFSLILEYNGLGRLDGQTGGPRLLRRRRWTVRRRNRTVAAAERSARRTGGWLLGMALVGGLGVAGLSRLRRDDPRTGWIVAVGGAFAITAVAFSFASGIFHPYYVSLLAPFAAALVGATFGEARAGGSRRAGPGRAGPRRRRDHRDRRDRQLRPRTRLAGGADRPRHRGRRLRPRRRDPAARWRTGAPWRRPSRCS